MPIQFQDTEGIVHDEGDAIEYLDTTGVRNEETTAAPEPEPKLLALMGVGQ